MNIVEPKIYYLSFGEGDAGGMLQYLEDNHIAWRPDPQVSFLENLYEFAGRLCYESWVKEDGTYDNKNISKVRSGNYNYLGNVLNQGHGSVFEHGGIVILFNDVSRVFTHELVRHRVGTGYSQTSGRYVRLDNIKFWVPPSLNGEAAEVFEETVAVIEEAQKKLEKIYDIDNMKDFTSKKKLTSAFRRLAPNGLANNIIMSTNMRNIRHVINMRASEHAEEEIQLVFKQIATKMKEQFPSAMQDWNGTEFANKKI